MLLEKASLGVAFLDRELRFQRVNAVFADIGREAGELPPELGIIVSDSARRVLQTGEHIVDLEARSSKPSLRQWLVSLYPVPDFQAPEGVMVVCEEVTERRRMEAETAAALERERLARAEAVAAERRAEFLASAAAILASSLDYRSTLPGVVRQAVPDIAAWAAIDLIHGDHMERVAETESSRPVAKVAPETAEGSGPLWRTLRTGSVDLLTGPACESGDAPRIIVPVRVNGHIAGTISMTGTFGRVYDASDIRLLEELAGRVSIAIHNARLFEEAEQRRSEAERAAAELRRVNQELEQFADLASHDLQEPLRTVTSFAQLLDRRYRDELPDHAREYLGQIVEGARRMSYLIRDVLEYSRVSRNEEPAASPVNMEAVFNASADSLRFTAEETGATLVSKGLPVFSRASVSQMQQLMVNLLSNALKYRRPGVPPIVQVDAVREDAGWHIRVEDNGQGFDAHYAERIFGIFRRLHGREIPGNGIGLALCRKIVERHGGRIWAESTVGQGTCFHFTIPD